MNRVGFDLSQDLKQAKIVPSFLPPPLASCKGLVISSILLALKTKINPHKHL